MRTKKQVLIKLLFVFILGIGTLYVRAWVLESFLFKDFTNEQGNYKEYLISDNLTRSYFVHLPLQYDGEESVPLLFVLHGAGANAEITMEMTGMNDISDKNGFIVVYPNGTGLFNNYVLSWNAGDCCNYVEPIGVDDVDFLRTLIFSLQKEYNIDSKRIYASGISNGGMMAYRLGCELSDVITGIASVSASMTIEKCAPSDFLPVIIFHGTEDKIIPYEGGLSDNLFVKLFKLEYNPIQETVLFWVEHNGCDLIPEKTKEQNALKEIYSGCRGNTEVVLYTVEKGAHSWPGGKRGWFLGDEPAQGIFASEIIWDFFETHPKT